MESIKIEGPFRKPDHNYFTWVFSKSIYTRQISPFMLVKTVASVTKCFNCKTPDIYEHSIRWVDTYDELYNIAKSEDIVLQAWPGMYRTDIFMYPFEKIKNYYSEHVIEV